MFEDLQFGLRTLARNRALAAIAILSLGLGVGANTTVFTLVRAILLRPIPVRDPSTLVAIHTVDSRNPGLLFTSLPNYLDIRDQNQVFSSLLLYTIVTVNVTDGGDPRLQIAHLVSANYFETVGVEPAAGRAFLPEEDRSPGAVPVAMISYGMWQSAYGGDPRIMSRRISLNGRPYQIVGVAPKGFRGLNTLYAADVFAPVAMYPALYSAAAQVPQRRALLFSMAGRLRPGITPAQAEASLQPLAQELERRFPAENRGRGLRLTSVEQASFAVKTRSAAAGAGVVLLIVSGLVLLIACANVANLLLARAAGRNKEIALRLALGSGRLRLVRQLLTESVALSLLGGLAGLLFARWGRDLVWAMRPPMFNHSGFDLRLDLTVFGYTLAVSAITGVLFGLFPALRGTSSDLARDLKERSGRSAGGRSRIRALLVAGQVAFSVVALIGAGLFIRSVINASRLDPGFDGAHLATVTFNVADQNYNEARGRDYQQRILAIAGRTPGVRAATLAKDPPFHVAGARTVILGDRQDSFTLTTAVWPGYFQAVGIPLLRGRDFSEHDTPATPHVALVNEAAAARFWPGQNPVGMVLRFFGDPKPAEVVGVARNANYQAIGEDPKPFIYLSLSQYYMPAAVLHIRTGGDPERVAAAVKAGIQPLERNFLLQVESVDQTIRESLWAQRLSALLLTVFGVLALLLAAIGIFGVVSYSVTQRTREFGVRMALGATAQEVQRMVISETVGIVTAGVLAGLALSLIGAYLVRSMLLVTGAGDAITFLLVPAVLTLVAVVACWIPSYRATRIDPAIALRDE